MRDVTDVIDGYIAMWNERDAERRRELAAQTVTEDATYLDPMFEGQGVDGFATMIEAAQAQFPGHRVRLAAAPDAHHDRVRFTWHLVGPDGDGPVAVGIDFATRAPDGRLRDVTGFLEAAA
jgi:SnoaL-like domain